MRGGGQQRGTEWRASVRSKPVTTPASVSPLPRTPAVTGVVETFSFLRDPGFLQRRFNQYGDVFETHLLGEHMNGYPQPHPSRLPPGTSQQSSWIRLHQWGDGIERGISTPGRPRVCQS